MSNTQLAPIEQQQTVAILNQYPKDQYNVLAPEQMTTLTAWHQILVCRVTVDNVIPQGEKSNGEVYHVGYGKYAMHKGTLLRLADAAGIRFKQLLPKDAFIFHEDGKITCTAIAEKQDPDGTWRQYPGTYTWDPNERLDAIKDPDSPKGQNEAIMIRRFGTQRAETGALSKAIKDLLPLKPNYSLDELAKPFIVARVNFNPLADPMVAQAFRQAMAVKLAHNLALMGGDIDPDDPLGPRLEGPTHAQLEAANETLALVGANGPGHATVEAAPYEPEDPEWTEEACPACGSLNYSQSDGCPDCGIAPYFAGEPYDSAEPYTREDAAKDKQPDPEPDPEQEEAAAKWQPEQVRYKVRSRAGWAKGEQADLSDAHRLEDGDPITTKNEHGKPGGQIVPLNTLLGEAVTYDGMSQADIKKARHDVLQYLCKVRTSTKLYKKEASALIEWLKLDAPGPWKLRPGVKAEAGLILVEFKKEIGQEALPGM